MDSLGRSVACKEYFSKKLLLGSTPMERENRTRIGQREKLSCDILGQLHGELWSHSGPSELSQVGPRWPDSHTALIWYWMWASLGRSLSLDKVALCSSGSSCRNSVARNCQWVGLPTILLWTRIWMVLCSIYHTFFLLWTPQQYPLTSAEPNS